MKKVEMCVFLCMGGAGQKRGRRVLDKREVQRRKKGVVTDVKRSRFLICGRKRAEEMNDIEGAEVNLEGKA